MGSIRRPAEIRGSMLPVCYVVVDVETTGLDPNRDELLEIGAVRVVNGAIAAEFQTLVNAKRLSAAARNVNGITREMLKGAPDAQAAVDALARFVGDDVLLAHNASFDKSFLEAVRRFPNDWIDTLDLAKILFPGKGGRSMSALCSRLGVENVDAHRALGDCRALNECYLRMYEELLETSNDARDIVPMAGVPRQPGVSGMSFAFTGHTWDRLRHDAMQAVADCGGTLHQGVTMKTDYLVDLEGVETSKCAKAREYATKGLPIRTLDFDEFLSMLPAGMAAGIAAQVPRNHAQAEAREPDDMRERPAKADRRAASRRPQATASRGGHFAEKPRSGILGKLRTLSSGALFALAAVSAVLAAGMVGGNFDKDPVMAVFLAAVFVAIAIGLAYLGVKARK